MQREQGGLECPKLALTSCLPSFLNDRQQVESSNGESNKPQRSCPPSSEQSQLYTASEGLGDSLCQPLGACGFQRLPGQSQSSCLGAEGLLKKILTMGAPAGPPLVMLRLVRADCRERWEVLNSPQNSTTRWTHPPLKYVLWNMRIYFWGVRLLFSQL